MTNPQPLRAVPTNVITGFLGVGKTTAIQHLLKVKPEGERWAVLVNEFGEVGIDGAMLRGQASATDELFIREVPGGCMCCSAGLPMQVALNQLLQKARPHRLLIEPTGLGHPQQILRTLNAPHYRNLLDLRATLTLVDPGKLDAPRYTEHSTFQQQLAIADIVVANKIDLYTPEQLQNWLDNLHTHHPTVYPVHQGALQLAWLDQPNRHAEHSTADVGEPQPTPFVDLPTTLPQCGYMRNAKHSDGYFSCGWVFDADFVFDAEGLFFLLSRTTAQRLKAVCITHDGIFAFNKQENQFDIYEIDDALDSRIELIDTQPINENEIETQLLTICQRAAG